MVGIDTGHTVGYILAWVDHFAASIRRTLSPRLRRAWMFVGLERNSRTQGLLAARDGQFEMVSGMV